MKKRILYVSSLSLEDSMGGATLMYRHLVERQDFDVLTLDPLLFQQHESSTPVKKLRDAAVHRIGQTRFYRWAQDCEQLISRRTLPKPVKATVQKFKPDLVLTLAHGDLFWTAYHLASQLNLPLVSVFHDWWPLLAQLYFHVHPYAARILERRFRTLYKESQCVFCVCEGIQQELGAHKNAHILYPIPVVSPCSTINQVARPLDSKFLLAYAGNMELGNGKLLRCLIEMLEKQNSLGLVLYGNPGDWPEADRQKATNKQILHSFVPSQDLAVRLQGTDALLTIMSFDPSAEKFQRTSFPSKLSMYCAVGKPLIVWGPATSTAAQFIKQYEAGIVVTDPDPQALIAAVGQLATSQQQQAIFSERTQRLYTTIFHPEQIHATFVQEIAKLLS